MKIRTVLYTAVLLVPTLAHGAQPVDDFDLFMRDSMKDFDTFISEANREFISFLRQPWKKYKGEEPQQKRSVPEPKERPVFNPQAPEAKEAPRQLSIREILDLAGREGAQQGTGTALGDTGRVNPAQQPAAPADKTGAPKPSAKPEAPRKTVIRDTVKLERPTRPATPKKEVEPVQPGRTNPTSPTPAKPAAPSAPSAAPAPAKPQPQATPAGASEKPSTPLFSGGVGRMPVTFGGNTYYVSNGLKGAVTLGSTTENAIADALETLYKSDYKPLVKDLTDLRSTSLRNDWALYLMIKDVAEKLVGTGNASVVLRQFLLNTMGYRARMCKVQPQGKLALLVAPSVNLYNCLYITEGGTRFYDVEASKPYSFTMCSKEAPDAKRKLDMSMAKMPVLGGAGKTSTHTSARTKATATASVPKALADFYNRVPQCDYSVYATAQVDGGFAGSVLPSLRKAIECKSETEAAGVLLDYCQNGFEYATDPEQFGYEKPFFVEELFYYPYCDCEDRSMLYRYLVKNLLGLDVVLLDYPGHVATAVRFNQSVQGDYVTVGGQRYTVCDPTYIGAGIGMAMPQFKNAAADVLKY